MKLLLCTKCDDVFRLDYSDRQCKCGQSWGYYLSDGLNASYGGPCIPLGFSNRSLLEAIQNQPEEGLGERFEAFIIPKNCPTMIRIGT